MSSKRDEAIALALAGVGTLIAGSTDHIAGDMAGGLLVVLGGAGLVRSVRGKRISSTATPNTRSWRISAYAFASLTIVGLLLFCAQFVVGLRPGLMWSAVLSVSLGVLGLTVVAIRSLWTRMFSGQ